MPKLQSKPAQSASPKNGKKTEKTNGQKSGDSVKVESKAKKKLPVLYPKIEVRLFIADPSRAWSGEDGQPAAQPLTDEIAKQLIGWKEETEALPFKGNYLLIDKMGKKVRCLYNQTNRPFYPQLCEDWMLEILRQKWKFNGETVIIDKYGMVHDGQHTLIGLILACQEWELDKRRDKASQKWQKLWKSRPSIDKLVVLGIEGDDDTVNTINTGKRRSEEDVLYRSERLKSKSDKDRLALAKILKFAVKLLWQRTSQSAASLAPRRPHSELFEFLARHEKIWECAQFIYDENNDQPPKLAAFNIAPGTAAGLLYMMGCSATDPEAYNLTNDQSGMDWKTWDKAVAFWTDLMNKGKKTEALAEVLLRIPDEVGGSYGRDWRIGTVIKAWNLYVEGSKLTQDEVEVERGVNPETQNAIIIEEPRIGGIDVSYEVESRESPVERSAVDGGTEDCIQGGQHEWHTEKDGKGNLETFCKKCLDPKTPVREQPK